MGGAAVCRSCLELVAGRASCPRCKRKVERSPAAFEAWERARVERRIAHWHESGLVNDEDRARMLASAAEAPADGDTRREGDPNAQRDANARDGSTRDANARDADAPPTGAPRHVIERHADDLFASTATFLDEAKARYVAMVASMSADAPPPSSHDAPPPSSHDAKGSRRSRRGDEATELGRAVFSDGGSGGPVIAAPGLDALGELDDDGGDARRRAARDGDDDDRDDDDDDDDDDDRDRDADDDDARATRTRPGRFGESRPPAAPAPPMGALQVFWFIGAILVLAGSLMGVREAWRSLEGVMRPLVIASALFAYHVAFVALSRVLARRSEVTGRVLGVIAISLAPVAFVALAVAVGTSRSIGVASSAAFLAASCATLLAVGTVFSRGVGKGLVLGLLPCLAFEVALGGHATSDLRDSAGPSLIRLLVPVAALAPLAFAAVRARIAFVRGAAQKGTSSTTVARASDVSGEVLASLAGAAYGAIVVALYALFGGPNEDALDAGIFGAPLLACVLWIGLSSLIGWFAMAGGAIASRLPRAAPVLRIVMLAVLLGAALTGSASALGAGHAALIAEGVLAFAPSAVAALATLALFLEQRRHPLALHFAIPVAHIAVALDAFVLTDRGPPVWVASMALVPAALLLVGPLVARSRSRRTGIAIWATASSIIVSFLTLGVEPVSSPNLAGTSPPFVITAGVAALLCVAAHLGGRSVRPGQHYLGAVMAIIGGCAWLMPSRPESAWFTLALVLDGVAIAYGLAALAYGAFVPLRTDPLRAKDEAKPTSKPTSQQDKAIDLRPFDDVSLLTATLSVYLGWIALGPGGLPARGLELEALSALLPTALAALVLALRAGRDRSRLVTLHAGLGIGVALQLAALAMANLGTLSLASIGAAAASGARSSPLVLDPSALTTANEAATGAVVAGISALFLIVPATLRRAPEPGASRFGRTLFGFVPLPLGARGRTVLDGFGLAAIVFAALGCARGAQWIATGVYLSPQRELVLLGLVALVVAALAAFLTRALESVRARGNVASLAIGATVIVLTAIAYRIGRPLPPAVVGWRLTLVLAGVWLLARLVVWKGPALATALGRPWHGARYHVVVHAGVLGLAALLLVDAVLIGAPTWTRALVVTAPMLLFGGALGMILLYRSSGWRAFLHLGLGSLFFFACFVGAQRGVLGPELAPLDPPGGRWILAQTLDAVRASESGQAATGLQRWMSTTWLDPSLMLPRGDTVLRIGERAIVGTAGFALVCAAALLVFTRVDRFRSLLTVAILGREDDKDTNVEHALLGWTCGGGSLTALTLSMQPSIAGAAVLVLAGAVAAFARTHISRSALLVLAAPIMIHALAHGSSAGGAMTMPLWAGPSFAMLALVVVVAGVLVSRRALEGRDPTALIATQVLATTYGVFAVENAIATGGELFATGALLRVMDLAQQAMDGSFAGSIAPTVTFGLLTLTSAIAAWEWRGALARLTSIAPPLLLGVTVSLLAATRVYTTPLEVWTLLVTRDGPLLGAALAFGAIATHVSAIALGQRALEDAAWGTRVGRDALLGASALAMTVFVLAPEAGGFEPHLLGLVALGGALGVAVHAIVRESSARHVYFVELLVVGLYAFATRAMNLRPEIDALIGLAYGFTLLGVATIARRRGIVRVADATRRFLAMLPILIAFATMRGPATGTTAMFAVGSSLLYFVVALAERSRAFGSLAAIAANIALIVFALSEGLDGIEIWLGPLGLLVAAISQIFASKMSLAARSAVRITGGALLYLPSGMKLALRLGAAEDATYSVVFGAVCLLGVVAGVALKVRAYLALATLSLTLDVIANLVHAGLRDHRLGFVILSASGLFILAVMILVTLRRERARELVGTVRSQLEGWD